MSGPNQKIARPPDDAVEKPSRPNAPAPFRASAPVRFRASAPPGPLTGTTRVPGDKSISHRALMLGALAIGNTDITGLLEGEDVLRTAAAMRALGARVDNLGGGAWRVAGRGVGGLVEPADVLDMGNSGTASRLLCGLLAGHPIFAVLTGDASLRRRPMHRVTRPLAATGARFITRAGGRLPLAVEGAAEPMPLDYSVPVASAQVKSACLLAGLSARGTTRIEEAEATRDHTENMLRHFGAEIRVQHQGPRRIIELVGQPELTAAPVTVPGDPSSAAFLAVAALLVPGSAITITGVGVNPLRSGIFACLREMGGDITETNPRLEGGEPVADLAIRASALRGITVPAGRAPSMIDEYPVLAVAAACASGTTRMRGLAELRVKESDRLAAIAGLLDGNGIRFAIEGDDLVVHGTGAPPAGGGLVETHMDHRIAMSALVLGLASNAPVAVDDAGFIETSFPGFAALINRLAANGDPEPGRGPIAAVGTSP